MQIVHVPTFDYIIANDGSKVHIKRVSIPAWNMDTSIQAVCPHGISGLSTKFVGATINICHDSNFTTINSTTPILKVETNGLVQVGIFALDDTNITLYRLTGGVFDSAGYDAITDPRGWMWVWYTE